VLRLPEKHFLGANKELIDTIGVAADRHAPLTAHDLSTGRDPRPRHGTAPAALAGPGISAAQSPQENH
jgi:hypothetical protein